MVAYISPYNAQQQTDAANLANLLNQLNAQGIQAGMRGASLAGSYALANADGQLPMNPMAGGAPGNPQSPPQPNPAAMQSVPMPGAVPVQGGMPGSAQPGGGPIMMPQVPASQLQPPQPGGTPAPQPGGTPASQPGGASAASLQPQVPWWKSMAAQIKQQNPNVSGQEVMAALNAWQSIMNPQNKQQFLDLRMQLLQQKLQTGTATPQDLDFLVEEMKAGNQSILTRAPWSVRAAVMEKLQTGGTSGTDAAAATLNYKGLQAAETTAGHRMGASSVSSEDLKNIGPQAVSAATAALPKDANALMAKGTNWLSEMQNDPKYAAFAQLNDDIINAWARSVGGGVANVSTIAEGAKRLGNSRDLRSWMATYNAMYKDINANLKGGGQAVKGISDQIRGGDASSAPAPDDSAGIKLDAPPPSDDPMRLFQ